jgi:hypothetical protein
LAVTLFQKFCVAYNYEAGVPLDYSLLKEGGYEAIAFRPEEGEDLVSQRMDFCRKQMTWREQPFDANIWFADPLSDGSIKAGIPTPAAPWARWVVSFVKSLPVPPKVLALDVEFSAKGYPAWKPGTIYKKWDHVFASAIDPMDQRVKNFLFVTTTGGTSGWVTPKWVPKGTVTDKDVLWQIDSTEPQPYQYAMGWSFNEIAANLIFAGLPGQNIEIWPMSNQADFNYGAWMKRGARCCPQTFGSQPYLSLRPLEDEIENVVNNHYIREYYGFTPDRRRIHPTIGAFGQGWFYIPSIKVARTHNTFGIRVFPHNNLAPSDYIDYKQFVVP